MIDAKGRFVIEDYAKKSVFSGFLPGISGINGIPIWCYYVNRGQCVSCFGSEDKDHSIMEFSPAHQAYLNTSRMGYRTFLKVDGTFYEAFADADKKHKMYVDKNTLSIEENASDSGITTQVTYYTLPDEKIGALVRKVTFVNKTDRALDMEFLDGCPAIIPYGVEQDSMKNMTQTAKAWMQVEDVDDRKPFFRVRASMADSTKVVSIESGNFSICVDEMGEILKPVVDTEAVFDYDTAYQLPHVFMKEGVDGVYARKQMTMNRIPSCFYGGKFILEPNAQYTIYQVTGQAANKKLFHEYLKKDLNAAYFEKKLERAEELTREITQAMDTKTANPAFDAYCRQDFLDNVLRGGLPIKLGDKEIFYVYARKHGDMERDYNYFRILPEFYSQGNGNFRDINQNRRCDTSFFPQVGDKNIHMFYDFIQLDGYNPLGVEKTTYKLSEEKLDEASKLLGYDRNELSFLTKPFTPGSLAAFLVEKKEYETDELTAKLGAVADMAESLVTSDFLEGYWCDHWTYNLDLIENYLSIYPEKEYNLLYEKQDFVYMKPGAGVYPRSVRYVETEDGIRQYKSVYPFKYDDPQDKLLQDKSGNVFHTTLMEKLILLNCLKFATLDPYGCGMEMEGGKPGWYDALNGLPGLLGSSMPETCELARNLEYTVGMLSKYNQNVKLLKELYDFMQESYSIVSGREIKHGEEYFEIWDKLNTAKEAYREKIYGGVSGEYKSCDVKELITILDTFYNIVRDGIDTAVTFGGGLIPTYFTYQVTDYNKTDDGIKALKFKQHVLPHFLEGPVRFLKLSMPKKSKKEMYDKVQASGLYDTKLSMYKVNAPITEESYELGRCRAFTPGWLENESIWLHMEYKYLLELLKSGLYEDYIDDLHKTAIPFLSEEMYGRSILENSSFLASSANPDEKIHGKGFVARLSGSTVEFMDMWQTMMFGRTPFVHDGQELSLGLEPLIPAYLITDEKTVEATFLGKTRVIYHVENKDKDYIPNQYEVTQYCLHNADGRVTNVYDSRITGALACDIRGGKVDKIEVFIK